jgi:hypothetical protein
VLTGDPTILFNIAQAYRQARNYEKAIQFYRSYLNRTRNPPNRAALEARIAELNELVEKQRKAQAAPPTEIQREGEAPPPAERVVVPEGPRPSRLPGPRPAFRYAGIALAAVGVGALASGAAMAALAVKESNDVQQAASARDQSFDADLQDRQRRGQRYQLAQIPLFVVGGAALVSGATLLWLGYRKPSPELSVAPLVQPGGIGLGAAGSF